jgi:hypothetical protein
MAAAVREREREGERERWKVGVSNLPGRFSFSGVRVVGLPR